MMLNSDDAAWQWQLGEEGSKGEYATQKMQIGMAFNGDDISAMRSSGEVRRRCAAYGVAESCRLSVLGLGKNMLLYS
jgi:hypothetical protein